MMHSKTSISHTDRDLNDVEISQPAPSPTAKVFTDDESWCAMLSKLYKPVKPICERLGVHPHIKRSYAWGKLTRKKVAYHLSGDTISLSRRGYVINLHASTFTEYRIKSLENKEWEEIDDILGELESDDVYWDIGAKVGRHTLLPAKVTTDGHVVAVEAHPPTASRLRENVSLNGCNNVTVIAKALGNETGSIEMGLEGDEVNYELGVGRHTIKTDEGRHEKTVEIPITTGDDLAENVPDPDVIKIDVEGAELDVIRGLKQTLSRPQCRTVFCEVHKTRGVDPQEVKEELSTLGFDLHVLEDRGPNLMTRSDKQEKI